MIGESVMLSTINSAEIKAHFSNFIQRVSKGRERLIVLRRGQPVAALISIEDLHRLEALDDTAAAPPADRHPVMQAFGGWTDRDDLDALVAEIYKGRTTTSGRELNL